MPTAFSNSQFQIRQVTEDLRGDKYFGSMTNFMAAFDNDNGKGTNDNTANCHLGMSFNPGFVGVLTQVKFFLYGVSLTTVTNTLKFQGSDDL